MAIAFKYACFQVFCIPTEEMTDPDGENHELDNENNSGNKNNSAPIEKATEAQIKAIKNICGKHKVSLDALYSSNNLMEETLTKKQASDLLRSLNAKYGGN